MNRLLLMLILLINVSAYSQQLYYSNAKQFPQTKGSVEKSILKLDLEGNKYLVGTFSGMTDVSLLSSPIEAEAKELEMFIAKYNSSDSLIWMVQVNDPNEYGNVTLYPFDLEVSSSGSVYVAYKKVVFGYETENTKKESIKFNFPNSNNVLKLDENGNTLFNLEFESYNENQLMNIIDVSTSQEDEFFITSEVFTKVNLNPLDQEQIYKPYTKEDIVIGKYDSKGLFMRSRTIVNLKESKIKNVKATSDDEGNFYIIGIMSGVAAFTQDSSDINEVNVGGDRTSAFITKYNRALSFEFAQVIDPVNASENVDVSSIAVQKNSKNEFFAVMGSLDFEIDIDPSKSTNILKPYEYSTSSYIAMYAKKDGSLVRYLLLGSPKTITRFRYFDFIPNGNIILAGETDANLLDLDPSEKDYLLNNTQFTNTHFLSTYNSKDFSPIQGRPVVYGYSKGPFFKGIAGTNSTVDILAFPNEFSEDTLHEQVSGSPFIIENSNDVELYVSYRIVLPVNISTISATNVSRISAIVSGSINDGEKDTILHRGFAYSFTNSTPIISNADSTRVEGNYGLYSKSLKNLRPKRTYYFRSFVKTPSNILYGEIKTFTTPFVVDTVKALTGVIKPLSNSITLNWSLPPERLVTNKFYIYRATDSTKVLSKFTLVDSLSRDTSKVLQTYISTGLSRGKKYSYYVIANADTLGPPSPFFHASLPLIIDTVKALTGVINNPPTSVTLNWNFPQERLITRKFYIYRATDSTTNLSNFTLIDSVARDTTDIAQTYTSSSLIGGNRYTFYVIAKADTIGPRSPFVYASLPAVPTAFSATKVLDTTKSITLSFSLAASDSATQRCIVYAVNGTEADSAQLIAIDTIVRVNKQTVFSKNYRTPFGKRIFNGSYTFRVRTLSKNVISEPTPLQTVVFAPDTLLFTTTPKDSACQDFEYQQNIQTKYTGIGELLFTLVGGPNGMTIDPNTGTLNWTPSTESLPLSTVVANVQSEYNPALKATLEYKIRKVDCTPPPEYNVSCGILNVVITGSSGSLSTVTATKVNENTQPDEIIEFKKAGTDTIRLPLPKGLYQVSLLQENGQIQWYNAVEAFESPDITIVCDDSVQANFTYVVVDTTPITFSGVLRNTLNNDPIVGSVRFIIRTEVGSSFEIPTNENGEFTARLKRNITYNLLANANGFLPTFLDSATNILDSRIIGPFDGNSTNNIIAMKPRNTLSVSIRGILMDEEGSRQSGIVAAYRVTDPSGRKVFNAMTQFATFVGTNGNWTLDNLEIGGYVICAVPLTGFAYSRTHVGGFYASNQNLLVDKWEDATIVPVLFNGVPLPTAIKLPLRSARLGNASFLGILIQDQGIVKKVEKQLSTISDPGVIIMLSDQNSKPAGFGISNNQGLVGITGLSGGTYNGTASKPGINSIDFTVEIDPKKRPDTVLITLDKTESDPVVSVGEKGVSRFTVSPNPIQSSMTISFEKRDIYFVEIMDLSGKSIASIPMVTPNVSSLQLSTMNIPNGVYYIVVTSKSGTETKLVIIQK